MKFFCDLGHVLFCDLGCYNESVSAVMYSGPQGVLRTPHLNPWWEGTEGVLGGPSLVCQSYCLTGEPEERMGPFQAGQLKNLEVKDSDALLQLEGEGWRPHSKEPGLIHRTPRLRAVKFKCQEKNRHTQKWL